MIGTNPGAVKPMAAITDDMVRCALCYETRGPLLEYSNAAVLETANHMFNSRFWRKFYDSLETISCHYD